MATGEDRLHDDLPYYTILTDKIVSCTSCLLKYVVCKNYTDQIGVGVLK